MSHKLFLHSIFSNGRVWAFLQQVDAAEAAVCLETGCPRCGGSLHSATYPRKPHGLAQELRDDVRREAAAEGMNEIGAGAARKRIQGLHGEVSVVPVVGNGGDALSRTSGRHSAHGPALRLPDPSPAGERTAVKLVCDQIRERHHYDAAYPDGRT